MTTLNKQGYGDLVERDIKWLEQQPRSPERDRLTRMLQLIHRSESVWSKEWPTKAGFYWFYGKLFGSRYALLQAQVLMYQAGHPFYLIDGSYANKDSACGLWTRAVLPMVPTSAELEEMLK